jgi:hypothetical protein
MPKVRLELKQETFDKLLTVAVADRRPVDWQAEVLLELALGIRPAGEPPAESATQDDAPRIKARTEGSASVVA